MKHGKDRLHIATKKHPGKWVSLAEKDKSVISVSDNAKKVYADAKKKGEKIPTVLKVPMIDEYFIR